MLEMINFVFPISAFMASSSRWGSYSDFADDGWSNDNSLQVVELSGLIVVNTSLQTVYSAVFRTRVSLQRLS